MFNYPTLMQARNRQLAGAIRQGEVVAYPTEAVWGLGCLPDNQQAVLKILSLKKRPQHKGLILVGGQISDFQFLLDRCSAEQIAVMTASWPGPNTWLVPHHHLVPDWICGRHPSVAIRVSAHPIVRQLCQAVGGAIVSTSANPQGLAPARSAFRARVYFGNSVCYAAGQIGNAAKPSQIRDLITGQIVRPS